MAEVLAAAFLIGSGLFLTKDEQIPSIKKPIGIKRKPMTPVMETKADQLTVDRASASNVFKVSTFNEFGANVNPNYNPNALWKDVDSQTMNDLKKQVDIYQVPKTSDLNDVGFAVHNIEGKDLYSINQVLPSIDDSDRDIQMIHNNMVPFFGSTVKQNINDSASTQHILETFTGNFRHSRRDNKTESKYLFDPTPNQGLVNGAHSNQVTNRDKSRFFPSTLGKKNNELPFEQIQVGKGIADGYTARPSGGFHQDVRILPKTTDFQVNPKVTYEGRIKPGRAPTEKGRLIGTQSLKSPKAIVWNNNGERNFTGMAAHQKNRQRSDVIFRPTVRHTLHSEYTGIAAPTRDSSNTPDALRGKKRVASKRNFKNTPFRNLVQASGKQMNDHGQQSFENRATERSQQSERSPITNVFQAGGGRNQQYNFNENGMRYTRKQELIENRPGSSASCVGGKIAVVDGKSGPHINSGGLVYDIKDYVAKTTIRETIEDKNHAGFVGRTELKGPAYDQTDYIAKTTIRETTEDNRHTGNINHATKKGPAYDQADYVAKTTIRETTENHNHAGFVNRGDKKGPAYDQDDVAKTTIRETTENRNHAGFINGKDKRGAVYDQSSNARTTIRETTEDHNHVGFVGKTVLKGKAYDSDEIARTTIRETTEDRNHTGFVSSNRIQNGMGYTSTNVEAKMPQKAYLCNHEYVGTGVATSNKMPKIYQSNYQVNTNKEQIAVGRAPNESKNNVPAGRDFVNIRVDKLEMDREVPHILSKGTSIGNLRNPANFAPNTVTSRKNVTPTHVDRLHVDILDHVKNNPLMANQSFN